MTSLVQRENVSFQNLMLWVQILQDVIDYYFVNVKMNEKKFYLKFLVTPGNITAAPPIGSTLGQHHINLSEFCLRANNLTKKNTDEKVILVICISSPKNYTIHVKTSPSSLLIKRYKTNMQTITKKNILKIVKLKKLDLKTIPTISITRSIIGTLKTMNIKLKS